MNAGRELDALVAERIMEYKHESDPWWKHPIGTRTSIDGLPRFSTDIAAAWLVVEHLTRKDRMVEEADLYFKLTYAWDDDYGCWAYFDWKGTSDTHPLYAAQAPTAPLAICLAALKAVGVEV